MSSYPPPTYVVPIYNPAYFASSTEGLTIGEASGIFLNKTSPDIATALETFNAGINTNDITPTTTASTLSLNSSKTGSTNADPAIAIATSTGITRTIKIGREGGTNPNSVHLAGLDVTNTSLNNITATTGVISIGNNQTDGILNLGTGTRTATGVINIGTGPGSGNNIGIGSSTLGGIISIQTQNTSNNPVSGFGAILIGTDSAVGKTIRIGHLTTNGTVTLGDLQVNSLPTSLNGIFLNTTSNTTRDINIGSTQTTGKLGIGCSINGTIGTRAVGGDVNIANQASNACAINIMNGGATVSGSVNIANVGANSTAINIGSTTGTGVINIETANTNNTPASSGAIQIGTTSVNKTIRIGHPSTTGTVTLGNFQVATISGSSTTFLNTITAGTQGISIGNSQTSAPLGLGTGGGLPASRIAGGDVNIANQASNACNINVMNGNTTGGNVNIANGSGATQTTAVNIGSGSTTGAVTIGNSANTVQVNGGLSIGTGKNITLQPTADYVAPTADTMLGGITTGSFLTPSSPFSSAKDIATITLAKGTYLIYFTFNANYTTLPTANYVILRNTGTSLPRPLTEYGAIILQPGTLGFNAFFPLSVTTAGTQILNYQIIGTINSITQATYSAVRIA